MKQAVALYDFDDTLANGDTINRLLIYDLKKHPLHLFKFIKVGLLFVGYKLHMNTFEKSKEALLFPLRSMDAASQMAFYKQHVAPYYYKNVVETLNKHKENGLYVVICTASTSSYMQYTDLNCDVLIGTDIDDHYHIVGGNCKGKNKIPKILHALEKENIEIDYENSYGYSDSNSDIPMLSLVKNRYRIVKKTGEIIPFVE